MSSDGTNGSTPNAGNNSERLTGRVKWFNNRAGFGFVTVMEGEKKDEDIFVHHSGIVVNNEQYKYLVQGEYVSFSLRESDNDDHPYQAGEVRGVLEGWLMCETRNANRSSREDGEEAEEEEDNLEDWVVFASTQPVVPQQRGLRKWMLDRHQMRGERWSLRETVDRWLSEVVAPAETL